MKNIMKLLIISSFLLIFGCGLDRSNPLDPEGGNINAPKLVTGIELSTTGQGAINKYITISWTPLQLNEANGYFIYRSRSYEGTYDLIAEINDRLEDSYPDTYKIVPGPYFYKMSAYIYLDPSNPNNNERLEGPLNRPGEPGIMVPQ